MRDPDEAYDRQLWTILTALGVGPASTPALVGDAFRADATVPTSLLSGSIRTSHPEGVRSSSSMCSLDDGSESNTHEFAVTASSGETARMTTRRPGAAPIPRSAFAGFRFPPDDVIVVALVPAVRPARP
jgi:hypothetical protein